jgi:NRPS condensation-like uncharacterized protein
MSNGLPMRMTSYERFHFHDDSPEYPNNIFARMFFEGRLEEEIARDAFDETILRHPLALAVVRSGKWREYDSIVPRFLWNRGTSVACQWLNLKLEKNCRLLCNYNSETDETEALFQVHHAAADGQGGLQFARDWMKIYDNLHKGADPLAELPVIDPRKYRGRNRLGLFSFRGIKTLLMLPIGFFGALKFAFRRPAPLVQIPMLDDDTLKDDFPAVSTYELSKSQVGLIKSYVNEQKITLNDWLVSCCYRSLMCWREGFQQHNVKDWYRIIVPMSIRTMRDRQMPACNRAALIQLDRRENIIVDQDHLNKSVSYELAIIRKAELQKIFLMVIKGFSLVPFFLRSRAKKQSCRAMTVLTNMGRPFLKTGLEKSGRAIKMGGALMKRAEMIPPIRYGTPVTFAVGSYAGGLSITMHVDTRFVRMEDAEELLQDFGNRVAGVA